jgi:hypothetical protein
MSIIRNWKKEPLGSRDILIILAVCALFAGMVLKGTVSDVGGWVVAIIVVAVIVLVMLGIQNIVQKSKKG